VAAEQGYDVTLKVDVNKFPSDKKRAMESIASVKRHLLAGPISSAFDSVSSGNPGKAVGVEYRPGEHFWVVPQKDQLTVIFSVLFRDPSDVPVAKVFLQEFAEARRQGGLGTAPPVTYTDDVPLELKGMNVTPMKNKSFVSFVIFPRNWEGAKRKVTLDMLVQFRTNLLYHIKAAKSYLHARMRAKIVSWLKLLKQAQPEIPGVDKEKKTATGRTFVRK
jgi:actin related protein 2/3 complex subunit 2